MRTKAPLVDGVLKVPLEIAKCPFCHTQLTISPDGWSVRDDDTWTCDSFTWWCETEPDVDDPNFAAWDEAHPYEYSDYIPLQRRIEKWMDVNFDWPDDDEVAT